MMMPAHGEPLNPSCPTITYSHLFPLYDHWHFPDSAREFKHFFQFTGLHLHVYILSLLAVSQPGPFRIGSTRLAINNNLLCHNQTLLTVVPSPDQTNLKSKSISLEM